MASPFVWFDLRAKDPSAARSFYEQFFGWKVNDAPIGDASVPMIGEGEPWALIAQGEAPGWLPYAEVEDVDKAAERAVELGATIVQVRTEGPAGSFVTVADPGGAALALWQRRTA